MPIADIRVNGNPGTSFPVPINVLVQFSNADIGGETTYTWSIIDQPEGPTDVLSNTSISTPTLTPKKEGTYLVRLVVNLGLGTESTAFVVVYYTDIRTGERVPAASETTQDSTSRGWAKAINRLFGRLTSVVADANIVTAFVDDATVFGIGQIVAFRGAGQILATLPGDSRVPQIAVTGTSLQSISGPLGQIIGIPGGGSTIQDGGPVYVCKFGLSPIPQTGTPADGAPVYVADNGFPSLTPGTIARVIGRVVDNAPGAWRWFVDGHDPKFVAAPRITSALEMFDAGANWTRTGLTGAGPVEWSESLSSSSALIARLKVEPGETLDSVDVFVIQGSSTARLNVVLYRGTASGNANGDTLITGTASGAQTFHFVSTGTLVMPLAVGVGEFLWLAISGQGAGAVSRSVVKCIANVSPTA